MAWPACCCSGRVFIGYIIKMAARHRTAHTPSVAAGDGGPSAGKARKPVLVGSQISAVISGMTWASGWHCGPAPVGSYGNELRALLSEAGSGVAVAASSGSLYRRDPQTPAVRFVDHPSDGGGPMCDRCGHDVTSARQQLVPARRLYRRDALRA